MALGAGAEESTLEFRHGISVIHELKYPADFQGFDYMNPNAPKGGALRLSTTIPIRNFADEWDNEAMVAPGVHRTYDYLLHRSGDELGSFYGHLAQSMALSSDKRSLHFRLHPHARWHDGVPVTPQDVKFTFDHTLGTVEGKVYMDWLEAVEIAGAREVVFRHKRKFTTPDLQLFTYMRILPAHYWKGRQPNETTFMPPLGSGPYRVVGHDRSHVRFERVRDYWGRDLPVNRGRYNFDEIKYDLYRDNTVAREAFRKGLFDFRFEEDIRHLDFLQHGRPGDRKGHPPLAAHFRGPVGHYAKHAQGAPAGHPRAGGPDAGGGLRLAEPGVPPWHARTGR